MTVEQLSDTSKATPEEKVAMQKNRSIWVADAAKWTQSLRQYGGPKDYDLASFYVKMLEKSDENLLSLYSSRITWGEFNARRRQIGTEMSEKNDEISRAQ